MNNAATWPDGVRNLVDQFLDQVDRALLHRSISRSERWNIVGELETQIETVVARRVEAGELLSVELMQSVLSSMDPPTSYGELPKSREVVVPSVPTTDRWAIVAFVFFIVSIVGLSTLLSQRPEPMLAMLGMLSMIAACGFGSWSIWRIRHADGWLHGLPWAFAAACGLPVAALQFAIWVLVRGPAGVVLLVALFIAFDLYGCYRLVRWAWQCIARGYAPRVHSASTEATAANVSRVTMSPAAS